MRMSGNRLQMGNGQVRHFETAQGRENFERYAQAINHGWEPPSDEERRKRRRRGREDQIG